MSFQIRAERPQDAPLIDPLLDRTFGPDRTARTVYRLREGLAPLDELRFELFDIAGVRLSLLQDAAAEPSSSVIYFRVADINAAVAVLKQKDVSLDQEPELVFKDSKGQFGEAGEEEWMAFFRDPDGNLLALACRK